MSRWNSWRSVGEGNIPRGNDAAMRYIKISLPQLAYPSPWNASFGGVWRRGPLLLWTVYVTCVESEE